MLLVLFKLIRGHYKPTPIALNDSEGAEKSEIDLGKKIRDVIEADLKFLWIV